MNNPLVQHTPAASSTPRPLVADTAGLPGGGLRDRHVTRSRWTHRRNRPVRATWKS